MQETRQGKTTIAPDVLTTVTRLATLKTEGVSRMANIPGGVDRFLRRGADEGVRIKLEDDIVYIDLYVILKSGSNVRQISREIQKNVARAIQEMIGMEIGHINIHIEDIDYPSQGSDAQDAV